MWLLDRWRIEMIRERNVQHLQGTWMINYWAVLKCQYHISDLLALTEAASEVNHFSFGSRVLNSQMSKTSLPLECPSTMKCRKEDTCYSILSITDGIAKKEMLPISFVLFRCLIIHHSLSICYLSDTILGTVVMGIWALMLLLNSYVLLQMF